MRLLARHGRFPARGSRRTVRGGTGTTGARNPAGRKAFRRSLEGLADLLQQLPEQRIVGGVVDREVEGEILAAGRALVEMHRLHGVEPGLDGGEVGRVGPQAATALASTSRPRRTSSVCSRRSRSALASMRERHVDGVGRDRAQQVGAAALARFHDPPRLELADDLPHRRAADRQRVHQLPLGRQAVAGLEPGARDEGRNLTRHARGPAQTREAAPGRCRTWPDVCSTTNAKGDEPVRNLDWSDV